jgi:yecA family protein
MNKAAAAQTYQLKITLNGSKPEIWRRLRLPSDTNLAMLHQILQITMGWEDYHLHEFLRSKKRYGPPMDEFETNILNEYEYNLDQLLQREGDHLTYTYDFGDNWEHEVLLEKITPRHNDAAAQCTAGGRACPPEDCGGIYGYARMLKLLRKPAHEEYEEILEWLGDDFDPGAFDKQSVNRALQRYTKEQRFAGQLFTMMESLQDVLGGGEPDRSDLRCIESHFPEGGTVGDDKPNLAGLHGYLTAIICAPLPVNPMEWMIGLNNSYLIVTEDQSEFNNLGTALLKRFNQLALAFAAGKPELAEPCNLTTTPIGTTGMELWCDGFMRGFFFNDDDWYSLEDEEIEEEVSAIVAIISGLALREVDDKTLSKKEFEKKLTMLQSYLPRAVHDLYDLARSEHYAHLMEDDAGFDEAWDDDDWLTGLDHIPGEPVKSEKIGRNEPCPCGSGLKYKKCCIDKVVSIH